MIARKTGNALELLCNYLEEGNGLLQIYKKRGGAFRVDLRIHNYPAITGNGASLLSAMGQLLNELSKANKVLKTQEKKSNG